MTNRERSDRIASLLIALTIAIWVLGIIPMWTWLILRRAHRICWPTCQ
jgi:hypothetical protein